MIVFKSMTIFFTDIPLIEQFGVSGMSNAFAHMSWLENKIYVLYFGSTTIRVFTDQAPFDELLEATQIPLLGRPCSMISSPASRSIFVSDGFGYIYKIQIQNGKIHQWKVRSPNGNVGHITSLSISPISEYSLVTSFLRRGFQFGSISVRVAIVLPPQWWFT